MATKQRVFRAYFAAEQLLKDLARTHAGRKVRMLDIGGAHGIHARFFRERGLEVDIVDIDEGDEKAVFIGDYLSYAPAEKYDVVWSSHVLEHVPNVGAFLEKMRADMAGDGYCVVTVPPFNEDNMAYNHITLWNPGILLLNAAYAGFDPASARLCQYGYNVSLIARKGPIKISKAELVDLFPAELRKTKRHFRGNVKSINWEVVLKDISLPRATARDEEHARVIFEKDTAISFCYVKVDGRKIIHYYDRSAKAVFKCR